MEVIEAEDACHVAQMIEPAPGRGCGRHAGADLGLVAHIATPGERDTAGREHRLAGLLERLGLQIDTKHAGAFLRQPQGYRSPDTGSGTRDQRHFALETLHAGLPTRSNPATRRRPHVK